MASDLKAERAASKLDLPQLTKIIDGGEDVTRRRRRMGKSSVWHFHAMAPVQLRSLRSFFLHCDVVESGKGSTSVELQSEVRPFQMGRSSMCMLVTIVLAGKVFLVVAIVGWNFFQMALFLYSSALCSNLLHTVRSCMYWMLCTRQPASLAPVQRSTCAVYLFNAATSL